MKTHVCPLQGERDEYNKVVCETTNVNKAYMARHIRRNHLQQALLCGFCRTHASYLSEDLRRHFSVCPLGQQRGELGSLVVTKGKEMKWVTRTGVFTTKGEKALLSCME